MRDDYGDLIIVLTVAAIGLATSIISVPRVIMIFIGVGLFAAAGYVWAEVLPRDRVGGAERFVLAAGIALMVPVLGGAALTAAGIRLVRPVWAGLFVTVTLAGAAAIARQRRKASPPSQSRRPAGWRPAVPHVLAFAAAIVIAGGAVAVAAIGAAAQRYPGYTQLWLSPQGQPAATASLGVRNQQGRVLRYRLVLLRQGRVAGTWNLSLADGQAWQCSIAFTDQYTISADLYRLPDLAHPYRYVTNGSR